MGSVRGVITAGMGGEASMASAGGEASMASAGGDASMANAGGDASAAGAGGRSSPVGFTSSAFREGRAHCTCAPVGITCASLQPDAAVPHTGGSPATM